MTQHQQKERTQTPSKLLCPKAGYVEPTLKNSTPTLILDFIADQKQNGLAEVTYNRYKLAMLNLSKQCDINNPYELKETIANAKWKNSTKITVVEACTAYLKFVGKQWQPPKYKREEKLPFIPMENEINALIANANNRYAIYLTILKETGIRTDELKKLTWTDINPTTRTITITPSKGSNPRILPITEPLIQMINTLDKTKPKILDMTKHTFRATFERIRNRTATNLNNPRIKEITLHTFRHYKGTMEYHKTKDIIHVKTILGHKTITSTMIYINLENSLFNEYNDEFICKTAETKEQAIKLIEIGFQYITTIEGVQIFKKRK